MAKKTKSGSKPKQKLAWKLKLIHIVKTYALPILLAIILVAVSILTAEVVMVDKIYPRVFVGDIHLGFLNKNQAQKILNSYYNQRSAQVLKFTYKDSTFNIDLKNTVQINTQDALVNTLKIGHEYSLNEKLVSLSSLLFKKEQLIPQISLNLADQEEVISKVILQPPQDALISISQVAESTTSANIEISAGETGLGLDNKKLEQKIKDFISFGKLDSALPTKTLEPNVTTAEAKRAKQVLESAQKEPVELSFDDQAWKLDAQTLLELIDIAQAGNSLIDKDKLSKYLRDLADKINQPVVEPQFSFDPASKRAAVFKPAQVGRELDIEKTATLITLALDGKQSKQITLPVKEVQPKIKTSGAEDFGIKELLAEGVSNFSGSIPNRIYNIGLAASRINGVLIPPGEVFSFNEKVGDISAESGYKPAYVIKSGRTVLDDGGGVCQVSTTVYRAILKAGLPVTSRTAHAYRVGYYEQGFPPGLDATVFAPSVDFKFKNDSPAHILIQAYTVGNTLYVDLYGTSDGRISILSTPVVTNQTAPPPELRQDDSNLPKGEVKQVDFPAWGANVSFTRTVKRAGEIIISETVRSNFRPWQAVYLVGTKEN